MLAKTIRNCHNFSDFDWTFQDFQEHFFSSVYYKSVDTLFEGSDFEKIKKKRKKPENLKPGLRIFWKMHCFKSDQWYSFIFDCITLLIFFSFSFYISLKSTKKKKKARKRKKKRGKESSQLLVTKSEIFNRTGFHSGYCVSKWRKSSFGLFSAENQYCRTKKFNQFLKSRKFGLSLWRETLSRMKFPNEVGVLKKPCMGGLKKSEGGERRCEALKNTKRFTSFIFKILHGFLCKSICVFKERFWFLFPKILIPKQ